jgi:tetratricopeptide (TPR) repeat protein
MEYETEVLDADIKINEYFYGTGQKDDNYKIVFGANEQLFINKANNLKYLGKYNEAIQTFQEIFTRYKDSIYALNNLALIYEELKEYELAIKLYEKIIDIYPKYASDGLYKISALYMILGDKETAGKYYIHYELSGGVKDEALMQGIRQLQ